MSYTRVNWNSTTTYVSADNLNIMDKGIKDLDTNIGDVTTLTTTAKTVVPAIKELKTGLEALNNNLNTNKTLITPLNNWTNNAVAFYAQKIGNRVFLGGMLNVGTITKGTTLAILPVGFRPAYLEVVSVSITSGTTGNTQLNLLSDGTIWIESIPSGALTISVNNISFAVN